MEEKSFVLFCFFQINRRRRTYDDAFPDDEWVGGGATPLLEFDLQPVGARRNWRNVLNRQRFEATLRLRRDIAPTDNLGQELTQALQRSIEQQIAADRTLTPHSTVHFAMQSDAFTQPSNPPPSRYVNSKKAVRDWTLISRLSRPD